MAQGLFDPNAFTVPAAKPMPVILVLDNSGSMSGEKIKSLNEAVHDMLETFKHSECADVVFEIVIVTFGTGVHLLQERVSASSIQWQDIPISDLNTCKNLTGKWDDATARGTPLGRTLKIVKAMIEDKTVIPSRAYRPAIVLVSDGHPNDNWNASLMAFLQEGRSSKCDRWAMAIGRDADTKVLAKFIEGVTNVDGTPRKQLYAGDAKTLRDNFKFITISLTNSVAIVSKSKVLTVQPISVKATDIDERKEIPVLRQEPKQHEEEEASSFEW